MKFSKVLTCIGVFGAAYAGCRKYQEGFINK